MNRAEKLEAIDFDTKDWEKLFYKYQQEYIRKWLKVGTGHLRREI